MGCFNSSGFISRLPILVGDRIVCFIGLQHKDVQAHELYYPDALVSPYFLPIRGQYNDYGSIEHIDRTPIVDLLEKYAGIPIEEIMNGIERCLYGYTINDNIEYWKPDLEDIHFNDEKEKEDYIKRHEKDQEQYKNLVPLFENGYIQRDGGDVTPVLMFEHEDIYDELFSKDGKDTVRLEKFFKYVNDLHDFYEKYNIGKKSDIAKLFGELIPSPGNNHISPLVLFDFTGKKEKELKKILDEHGTYFSLLPNANWHTLSMCDKLSIDEKFMVYTQCKDDLKQFVEMWYFYMECPMYFAYSKTAGEQWFNLKYHQKLIDVTQKKLVEIDERWNNDEIDDDPEDYNYGEDL